MISDAGARRPHRCLAVERRPRPECSVVQLAQPDERDSACDLRRRKEWVERAERQGLVKYLMPFVRLRREFRRTRSCKAPGRSSGSAWPRADNIQDIPRDRPSTRATRQTPNVTRGGCHRSEATVRRPMCSGNVGLPIVELPETQGNNGRTIGPHGREQNPGTPYASRKRASARSFDLGQTRMHRKTSMILLPRR